MSVAINVQRLRVRSLDVDLHEITWEIESTSEDILDYTFQLLRSESPEGPYEILTPEFEDQYLFIDNAIYRGHLYRKYFYVLKVKRKDTEETKEFGPAAHEPEADLIGKELRKHMNLLMREFAGRRCWLLPVRTFGQRCDCWNPTLQKRTRSGCLTCFDTGFVRGYMTPIETWVQIDPSPKSEQNANIGPLQQINSTARFGYYPPVKPRDLLIEGENKRWRLGQISNTEKHRALVHHEMQIHQIPPTDIEYRIEIDIGAALKDIWLAPSRNFTNPHTLESAQNEEIPDIFGIYPPP